MADLALIKRYEKTVIECLIARIRVINKKFSPNARVAFAQEIHFFFCKSRRNVVFPSVTDCEKIRIRYTIMRIREVYDQLLPEMQTILHSKLYFFLQNSSAHSAATRAEYIREWIDARAC